MSKEKETGEYNIKNLSNEELTEFITDIQDSSDHVKDIFDYNGHVVELIKRASSGKVLSRLDIFRAMNTIDRSFDSIPEELYVVDVNELLSELGL